IDAEVIGCDPPAGRTLRHRERLIERRLEPVFAGHTQIHPGKMAHRGYDDLRSERQRCDDDPRGNGAVIGAEWGAPSKVVEELAFDAVHNPFGPTRSVACRETPTILPVALEIHRIANRVLLLHRGCLAAVLKIVAAVLLHEGVPDAAKVDPHVRELM